MRFSYDRLEPAIALAGGVAAAVLFALGGRTTLSAAAICRDAGILMLLQSLVRDVYLLASGRASAQGGDGRQGWFLCFESALGLGLIAQGLLLWALGTAASVSLTSGAWMMAAAAWWLVGYGIREVVLEVRRDPGHLNLLIGPPARG